MDVYAISGTATAVYRTENRSNSHSRFCCDLFYTLKLAKWTFLKRQYDRSEKTYAGANSSKALKKASNHATVYNTLMSHSCGVNNNGNRLTCPATASGTKAAKCRRSRTQSSENGSSTSRMAFSWTCQPKRKDEYAERVSALRKLVDVGCMKR